MSGEIIKQILKKLCKYQKKVVQPERDRAIREIAIRERKRELALGRSVAKCRRRPLQLGESPKTVSLRLFVVASHLVNAIALVCVSLLLAVHNWICEGVYERLCITGIEFVKAVLVSDG